MRFLQASNNYVFAGFSYVDLWIAENDFPVKNILREQDHEWKLCLLAFAFWFMNDKLIFPLKNILKEKYLLTLGQFSQRSHIRESAWQS